MSCAGLPSLLRLGIMSTFLRWEEWAEMWEAYAVLRFPITVWHTELACQGGNLCLAVPTVDWNKPLALLSHLPNAISVLCIFLLILVKETA